MRADEESLEGWLAEDRERLKTRIRSDLRREQTIVLGCTLFTLGFLLCTLSLFLPLLPQGLRGGKSLLLFLTFLLCLRCSLSAILFSLLPFPLGKFSSFTFPLPGLLTFWLVSCLATVVLGLGGNRRT